jgi:hypothetical protein
MRAEQIQKLKKDVVVALEESERISERNDFLIRVVKQAVLSNGGEVIVTPELAEAAKGWLQL